MPPASLSPHSTEMPVLGKRKQPYEDGDDTETILDGRDTSPANLKRIKTAYGKNGLVCVSFLTAAKCDELIRNVAVDQGVSHESTRQGRHRARRRQHRPPQGVCEIRGGSTGS